LTVVIPVYNEIGTIREVIARVAGAPYRKEVIVIDDGSTDGTREELQRLKEAGGAVDRLILHPGNRGKGAAVRSGFAASRGDIVLIQDADLEYNPAEYVRLLEPILAGKADVVFGSRFLTGEARRVLFFWHSVANRILTLASNMFTNLNLTDMETCYKVFRGDVARALTIREDRFGFEPEITARVARWRCRIYEVGISYDGRSYAEGKKIGWRDAVWALVCVLRYGLFGRARRTLEDAVRDARAAMVSEGSAKQAPAPVDAAFDAGAAGNRPIPARCEAKELTSEGAAAAR
jgi:glycosyltransferase involved in cell wall biosynthesis